MGQPAHQVAAKIRTLVNDKGFMATAHNDRLHQINSVTRA